MSKALQSFAQRRIDVAAAAAIDDAAAAAAAGESFFVVQLEGLNGKGLQPLVQKVSKETPNLAVIALSVDAAAEKVFVFASVPKALQETLPANIWVSDVLGKVGGRGGGKAASAQGSGDQLTQVDAAVAAAKEVAHAALAS